MKVLRGTIVSLSLCILIAFVKADDSSESCSLDADGDCEEEKGSNFWGEIGFDKEALHAQLKDLGEEMNALEMEIVVSFLDVDKDRIVSQTEFERILSERHDLIVQRTFDTFNAFDVDDNGIMSFEEMQDGLEESVSTEDLVIISLDMDTLPDSKLSILQFLKTLTRLGDVISKALTPFLQLDNMLPLEAKKAIHGSIKMFKDIDINDDGLLVKEEYLKSMNRPLPNGKTLTDEQKLGIFSTLDVNKDDEITYSEFQVIMPQKQKDMAENLQAVFKETDADSDGYITKEELKKHLQIQSELHKIQTPSDQEIGDTFSRLDADDDERLSVTEMGALLEEFKKLQQERYSSAFKELDKDGNGVLSKDEIKAIAAVMAERSGQNIDADLLAKMLDKNEDGAVTFDEVQSMIQRFQQPQKP